MKRNRNTHIIAKRTINYRTNLEKLLTKLSKFKGACNQSHGSTILFQGIYLRNFQMCTQRHVHVFT